MEENSSISSTMADYDDPTKDPVSPYYIHPDSGAFVSIFRSSTLREGGENYFTWKNNFLCTLRSLNKKGFVDGTIEKPHESSPLYQPWERNNAFVMIWLRNAVSEELRIRIAFCDTARDAWDYLRQNFGVYFDLKMYQLRRRIGCMRQNGDSVSEYFRKLSEDWNELWAMEDEIRGCRCGGCECGIKEKVREDRQKEMTFGFLMGLADELHGVRDGLLCMAPLHNPSKALAMVLEAEEALAGARRSHGQGTAERCSHCGRKGHIIDQCFKLVGYPPRRGRRF